MSGDLTELGPFFEHIAVHSLSISFNTASCHSIRRFGTRQAVLAICLQVPLASVWSRVSSCSGTFQSIVFYGHCIRTFTKVNESVFMTGFFGVDGSEGGEAMTKVANAYFLRFQLRII